MKTLRRILVIILGLAVTILAIGFLLPSTVHIERSMVINSMQENLFEQVNTLKNWQKWSPWFQHDSLFEYKYSGPEKGKGASMKWQNQVRKSEKGQLLIHASYPSDSLIIVMEFTNGGQILSKFVFENEENATKITWSLDSKIGKNPVSRWISLFTDKMIGPDLETGLLTIAKFANEKKIVNGFEIQECEIPAKVLITIRDTASTETLQLRMSDMYKKISRFIKTEGLSPTGAPMAVFHNFTPEFIEIEACIPVNSVAMPPAGINCIQMLPQKSLMISYFGTRKQINTAYDAFQIYQSISGFNLSGPSWEEYVTNPNLGKDTTKWQTNIYFPVE